MFKGNAKLFQVSQPTLEDAKAKIGQLFVIVVTGSVDPLVIHLLEDRTSHDLLELSQLSLGLVQLFLDGSYLSPSFGDGSIASVSLFHNSSEL